MYVPVFLRFRNCVLRLCCQNKTEQSFDVRRGQGLYFKYCERHASFVKKTSYMFVSDPLTNFKSLLYNTIYWRISLICINKSKVIDFSRMVIKRKISEIKYWKVKIINWESSKSSIDFNTLTLGVHCSWTPGVYELIGPATPREQK